MISTRQGIDLPIARVVATDAGYQMLQSDTVIRSLVTSFCEAPVLPEEVFERSKACAYVGMGENAVVWEYSDTALKTSTRHTGKHGYYGRVPEDLIGQSVYLTTFRHEIGRIVSEQEIMVPEQYFAIRTPNGDYIQGQQFMRGWQSLIQHSRTKHMDNQDTAHLYSSVQQRIARLMARLTPTVRLGANDLGFQSNQLLHAGNVLVPESTPDAINAPLCIIDLPQRGLLGRVAIAAAGLRSKR